MMEPRLSNLIPAPEGSFAGGPALPAHGSARAPALSVGIRTYHEALSVEALVRRLTQALEPALGSDYDLIVVDDDSPDRTWELAQRLALDYPRLRVMRRSNERGLASAVIRGWQVARGAFLCVIDADLQHPPDVVVELYKLMARRAED